MNIDKKFSMLSFNARLLLSEMAQRKIKLKLLGSSLIVKAEFKIHFELLYDVYTALTPYPQGVIIDDKYYSKKYLERFEFKVAPGKVFTKDQINEATAYAKQLGFPVVLKPTVGSHGKYVFLDIDSEDELKEKIRLFLRSKAGNGYFLIEKQFGGNEYRLFITKTNFFAAISRTPANVLGDGKNNLESLVKTENYRRVNPRNSCLCEIQVDRSFLKKHGLTLKYVPGKNEQVFLRSNSNVSTGGNCYDVTDSVHPTIKKLAKDILSSFGDIPFVGIDLLCQDITKPLKGYVICELNGAPGLSLHMMPEKGKSRNVAKEIVDILFPETASSKKSFKKADAPKISKNDLLKLGGKLEQLADTNMYFVTLRKRKYFFVGEFNESIPFIYGIFSQSREYINDLQREGIEIWPEK